MKLTASARVILVLLGLCLAALAVTGSAVYSSLSYLWLFLLLGNWVWSALALRGVAVRRTARTLRAQVGQIYEERFAVENAGRLPRLWLEIRDESPLPETQGSHVVTLLAGRQTRMYRAVTRLTQRGVFPRGPTVIASGDPFGLFPVSRRVAPEPSLLVYPMMVEVHAFPSPVGLLPGGEAVRRRTHQITPNASGVRDYAPGDPLSRIHWLSTARRGRLMAKEFELDPLAPVWIFVDAAKSVQAALPEPETAPAASPHDFWREPRQVGLRPATEDYAASAAASLARYFLRRRRVVGLVCSGASHVVIPAEPGGRQLSKILEALAVLRAAGRISLLALVMAQVRHLPRGATVVVITPSPDHEVLLAVDVLQRRGLRPVAVLLDSASFGGRPGTAAMGAALRAMRVPVRLVANGDSLEAALTG